MFDNCPSRLWRVRHSIVCIFQADYVEIHIVLPCRAYRLKRALNRPVFRQHGRTDGLPANSQNGLSHPCIDCIKLLYCDLTSSVVERMHEKKQV